MNCRFYSGWRFYNQGLEVELKIPGNRNLSNKYACFWRTFSVTWKGFFCRDWNLENYVPKIIKNRYSHTLEDLVHKIYNKMDLLLFADGDEAPNNLLNSEDSNKSLNKKVYGDEVGENYVINEPVSAENGPFQLQKDDTGRLKRITQEDHDQKLIEAKQRRERAQRFSSFTSWIPDLQRVWAPKQKGMKLKTDPLRKYPKRKERQRASYDTVCETPMTGKKRSGPWTRGSDSDDDSYYADGSQTCGSFLRHCFRMILDNFRLCDLSCYTQQGCCCLFVIPNALYVPSINQNLFSLGQMLENNYSLNFRDITCKPKSNGIM